MYQVAVAAVVAIFLYSTAACADAFTDALRLGSVYGEGAQQGTIFHGAFQPHQYTLGARAITLTLRSGLNELGLRSDASIRVCVSRRVPNPVYQHMLTTASSDFNEELIGGRWTRQDGRPNSDLPPCISRNPDGLTATLPVALSEDRTETLVSDFVFGSEVTVDVWFPIAPAPTAQGSTAAASCVSPRVVSEREATDTAGNKWVLVRYDLHIWDWDEYRFYEYDGGYHQLAELDTAVPVSTSSRILIGRLSEEDAREGSAAFHRRRAAWHEVLYDNIFARVCVMLVRSGRINSTTNLRPACAGEPTDRAYSIESLPVEETGEVRWGIEADTDGRRCVPIRTVRIVRRPVGAYLTFPVVSEVVAAATHLDPANVQSTSSTAVSYGCTVRPDFRCYAGVAFPLVFSYNFRSFTLSNYLAGFVGPQVLIANTTPHFAVTMGVRLLNSILVGASYDLATDEWQLMLGGDVTGLGNLISRFRR